MFDKCERLHTITFAEDSQLTELEESTFILCTNLKTVAIPAGVKTIGVGCFQRSGLESITFSGSNVAIEKYAFSMCQGLKALALPQSMEAIPEGCFWKSGIERIRVPKGVQKICNVAFQECR